MPASTKGFLDRVVTRGFAFREPPSARGNPFVNLLVLLRGVTLLTIMTTSDRAYHWWYRDPVTKIRFKGTPDKIGVKNLTWRNYVGGFDYPRPMELPEHVSAIVFDCDGLLVDTEPAWTVGEAAIFAENGFEFGPEQKALVIGKSIGASCAAMAEYFGRPGQGAELEHRILTLVEEQLLLGVVPLPGVVELLDLLGDRLPIAVASNSNRRFLDVSLAGAGLADRFIVTVSADDVEHPKPSPDLYLEAFSRLGADPADGIALEDSATGAASARASGAFVFAVPSFPGEAIEHDFTTASLADPAVLAWGRTVTAT